VTLRGVRCVGNEHANMPHVLHLFPLLCISGFHGLLGVNYLVKERVEIFAVPGLVFHIPQSVPAPSAADNVTVCTQLYFLGQSVLCFVWFALHMFTSCISSIRVGSAAGDINQVLFVIVSSTVSKNCAIFTTPRHITASLC